MQGARTTRTPLPRRCGNSASSCCAPNSEQVKLSQNRTEAGRRIGDGDAGAPHRLELVAGAALAARDDGAGVAHAAARRRGHPGDEADDRLLDLVRAQELRGILLGGAADLADHDDTLGLL